MHKTINRDILLISASELKIIPTLNNVVKKTLDLLNSSNSTLNDIFNIIKYDYAISSKIINIANSAFYSRGMKIYTLERAIVHIGFNEIKKVITSILFIDNILLKLPLQEADKYKLWIHSLNVACAGKKLAEKLNTEDRDIAFTAGLFHDLGKVVFLINSNGYNEIVDRAENDKRHIHEYEMKQYGIDHQKTGLAIATKWRLPEEIRYVISTHHDNHETSSNLVNIVRAANNFSLFHEYDGSPETGILMKEYGNIQREITDINEFFELQQP